MANDFRVVTPDDLGDSFKLGLKTPNKYDVDVSKLTLPAGVNNIKLDGTKLVVETSDGDKEVDLASLVPTIAADVFLKKVERQADKIVFIVGEKDSTANDTKLEVEASDLVPVSTDGTSVKGAGTTASPLSVGVSSATTDNLLKLGADGLYVAKADVTAAQTPQVRDIRFVNASGTTVLGYGFSTEQ